MNRYRGSLFHLKVAGAMILGLAAPGCRRESSPEISSAAPRRILSLAPNITETLFALGLGERVVGVTTFCTYPPEAQSKTRVGGYLDPSYETIVRLKPDLVILMAEHVVVQRFLAARSVPYMKIDNETVAGILESIRQVGQRCGRPAQADSLVDLVRREMVEMTTAPRPPRMLMCVGRDNAGGGSITRVFAAGRTTFYNDLMGAAGAVNAFPDSGQHYPQLSAEGIAALAPDMIVDLMATMVTADTAGIARDWTGLTMVPAVRNGMVFCLTGSHLTIPGPRIVRTLKDLKTLVRWYSERVETGAAEQEPQG